MKEKILNRETPFTDLLKKENLKKIDIDKKLIPAFTNVMNKLQMFFKRHNLLGSSNYALLFEKYLLASGKNKFSIKVDKTSKYLNGVTSAGFYSKEMKSIVLDSDIVEYSLDEDSRWAEATLTHEFVHFLVHTDLPWIETKDGDFVQYENYFQEDFIYGGFIDEGFTQIITEMLYPERLAYRANTSMMKMFLNAYATQDFFSFFRGRLPGKKHDSLKLQKFVNAAEKQFIYNYYTDDKYGDGTSWEEEMSSVYYQETFNLLVDVFKEKIDLEIERFNFATPEEFVDRLYSFKSLSIYESSYLESALNELITDYVDVYYAQHAVTDKFKVKDAIESLLINRDTSGEPGLEGIYITEPNNQGYYSKVKVFQKYIELCIYSPGKICLREDKVIKMEGASGGYELSGKLSKNEVAIDFKILNNELSLLLYDAKMLELTEEQIKNLDKSKLPVDNVIDVYDNKAKQEILQGRKEDYKAFEQLLNLMDKKGIITRSIVKDNEQIVSVFEIKNVFPKGSNSSLYLSANLDMSLKYYYSNGDSYTEINQEKNGSIRLPLDTKKEIIVYGEIIDERLAVKSYSKKGAVVNHIATPMYYTTKTYVNYLDDKEKFEKFINGEIENSF